MEDLSLHILDIALNSVEAGATLIEITLREDLKADLMEMEVKDNGRGMNRDVLARVADPFFTTKPKKKSFGLGIPFLKQYAEECGGSFSITSRPGAGTTLRASFKGSHIDRKPIGNLGSTMASLVGGHPEMDFKLSLEKSGNSYYKFDSAELKKELEGVPVDYPPVLAAIREEINAQAAAYALNTHPYPSREGTKGIKE